MWFPATAFLLFLITGAFAFPTVPQAAAPPATQAAPAAGPGGSNCEAEVAEVMAHPGAMNDPELRKQLSFALEGESDPVKAKAAMLAACIHGSMPSA
jgi:hypothetical protein